MTKKKKIEWVELSADTHHGCWFVSTYREEKGRRVYIVSYPTACFVTNMIEQMVNTKKVIVYPTCYGWVAYST